MSAVLEKVMTNSRTYELPIARSYVKHWGMAEAVREIIQNALDSESPFEYEFKGTTLTVRSRFATLPASTLLLGATSKADNPDTIGSFGEGYKIALLVLVRAGYGIRVLNGDRVWTPMFKHSRQFDAEVLCIEDTAAAAKVEGLAFEVSGLSPADIAQVRESCLFMQDHIGALTSTSYGSILRERPGHLYVGGLFVCETKLKFGYDVKPQHLALERDRQTVSSFDLQFLAKSMWFETQQWDEIATLIEAGAPDMEYATYSTPELVKEACYRAFREKHPGAAIAMDQAELNSLVKRGMTNVVVHRDYAPYVSTCLSYRPEMVAAAALPADVLAQWFRAHRKAMRTEAIVAFKALLVESENWRAK
jgi:hypothetical protein